MVSTNDKPLTFEPDAPAQQPARQLTDAQQEIPATVYAVAIEGGDVDALELLPGEQWRETPYLLKDLENEMVARSEPFRVLYVEPTDSSYGPIWRIIIDLHGQVFSMVKSRKLDKADPIMERTQDVLRAGARSVGPFILVDTDTGMQQPWRHLRPVSKTHKGGSDAGGSASKTKK